MSSSPGGLTLRLRQAVNARDGEGAVLLWSTAYYFLVLCAYYVLRPIRDDIGAASGAEELAWLFTGTMVGMLAVHPLYTALVSRLTRRRFVAWAYRFFIANLVAFYLYFRVADPKEAIWAGRLFFIWTSVFNLFVVSVFWSLVTDLFRPGQGKRLFGVVAVGGTLGAMLGATITSSLVGVLGPLTLMLVSALILELAVRAAQVIDRHEGGMRAAAAAEGDAPRDGAGDASTEVIGGGVLDGIRHVFSSPYLFAIATLILFYTITSTFLYFQQADIVKAAFGDDREARTRVFALMDLVTNALTLAAQLFLTGRVMKWLGVGMALMGLPLLTLAGFGVLGLAPTLAVLVTFQVARRAGNYAIQRPAREALFTVLPRTDKYKAKHFADTFVYRLGDQVGAWSNAWGAALGLGASGLAFVMVPFSALWLGLSLWLGRQYARRERAVPVALLLAVLALGTGRAAGAQARHGFVFVRGADTMGTEVVTAARAAVLGDIRMTGQPRMSWRATLGDGGVMQGLQLDVLSAGPGEGRVLQRVALRQEGDTVVVDITAGSGTTSTQRIASQRGAFLLVNASAGMLDLLLARAAATPAAVDTIPVFLVGGGVTMPSVLSVRGDSASWQLGGSTAQLVLADGRVQEVRLPAQDFRMRRVPAAEAMAHAGAAPDYRAPAGAPYTAENVRIPATGGHELAGTFTRPRTATGRLPAVVTITGSGAQDRDEYINMVPGFRPYRQLADTLGHHGFAVLRYDDRGFGESGGSFAGSTSRDFADDVRSAIRWLRQRPDIDPARIFLVGHSEGGMIAPMVAADDPTVAGIVLLGGPAKSGLAIIRFQQRYAIEHSPEYTTQAQRDSVQRVSEAALGQLRTDKWLDFFLDYDPLQTARRVRVPTFVVQGATDQQVTPEQAAMLGEALRAGGNGDVTVTVFADRNHLFLRDADGNPARYNRLVDGHVDAEVMGALVDWLAARAARAGGAR